MSEINISSVKALVKGLKVGQRRAIARSLSIIENDLPLGDELMDAIFSLGGKSKIFGITGAPGAGKSTLIDTLIQSFLKDKLRVAVLAIDPSSPFTGGALLGDRARMFSSGMEDRAFIRSSASRGQLGGLSPRTPELIHVLDAAQFDIIIVETVGVGQAELDIMKCADIVTLVMSPHTGDSLQALKAGIIEIADIFALNKADLPGINELERDLLLALSLSPPSEHQGKLIKTKSLDKEGVDILKDEINFLFDKYKQDGILKRRKERSLEFQLEVILREEFSRKFNQNPAIKDARDKLLKQIFKRKTSPRNAGKKILKEILL